jgi:hypothetical protein
MMPYFLVQSGFLLGVLIFGLMGYLAWFGVESIEEIIRDLERKGENGNLLNEEMRMYSLGRIVTGGWNF